MIYCLTYRRLKLIKLKLKTEYSFMNDELVKVASLSIVKLEFQGVFKIFKININRAQSDIWKRKYY